MSQVLIACLLASAVRAAQADGFLHSKTEILKEEVEQILFEDLFHDTTGKVAKIEGELQPLYLALPKNSRGTLDPPTVRYALHRYFVAQHGWYMKGIDPSGQAWNSSSATTIMKNRAPEYIMGEFTQRLHVDGMGLHELAAFAAALIDLVNQESVGALEKAFETMKVPLTGEVPEKDAERATKAWFMNLIMDSDQFPSTGEEYAELEENVKKVYPGWDDTYMWVNDVRSTADFRERNRNPFVPKPVSFQQETGLVTELGYRWGGFQNLECHTLKSRLVDMEDEGTGRVPLSSFYSGHLQGDWTFSESTLYLRILGALDEADPARPSVVIPNYLTSQTNCLSSSSFYATCCSDQCEPLMQHIEGKVAAPTASPEVIARIVSMLPSDTVDAPRNLSMAVLGRLQDISAMHGGEVPLYGRLFSQWLHHVYPRECPYPHVTGSYNPLNVWEFVDIHGIDALEATHEEMSKHNKTQGAPSQPRSLPWSSVEELVASKAEAELPARSLNQLSLRNFMAITAVLSFLVPLLRSSKHFCQKDVSSSFEKHFV